MMNNVSKMSHSDLTTLKERTGKELERRASVSKVMEGIQQLLHEHNLSVDDIDLRAIQTAMNNKTRQKNRKKTSNRKRAKVAPRYVSADGTQYWTGRGRTPLWVKQACEENKMDVESFKASNMFKVKLEETLEKP